MDPLPDWIDRATWDDWKKSRKAKKWSQTAYRLALGRLYKLKELGHDPNECLAYSAFKNWDGIFPPPEETLIDKRSKQDEILAKMEQDRIASQSPRALEAKRAALGSIKLVVK